MRGRGGDADSISPKDWSESSASPARPGIRVAMSVSETFVSPCVEGGRDSSGRVLDILP